jgi:Leucine-rich repeat (LRR) protein
MIALNQTNHDLSERIVGPKVVPSALRGEYCPSLIPAACRAQLQARHSGRIPLTYIEYDWLKEIYAFYDESFAPWTEIRYLDLSEANLSDAALGKILSKFPNVIVLNLRGNSQVSDLRPLARLIALRDLDLRECEQLSDLAPLEALPSLHSLKLDNCPKVANLEPLQRLFSLRRLYFSATGVAHLAPIAGLIFLEYLELDHCPKILSAEFVYLEKLVLLEFLKTNVEITDHDFIFLAEFSSLKHLFLSNCSKVTNIGLSYLTQLGGLQILTIAQAGRITGVGLQHLAQIKSLQNLGIFGVPYIANAQLIRLARLPALTDLVIGRHGQMIQVDIDLLRSIGA